MGKISIITLVVMILYLLQSAYALPDSSTQKSGNDCTRAHSLKYTYSITAPKSVNVGDTVTIALDFKLTVASNLRSAPYTVTATLGSNNLQIATDTQKLSLGHAEWQVTAVKAGTASVTLDTEFIISGSPAHSGYQATYNDGLDFSISITDATPVVEPPISSTGTGQTGGGQTGTSNGNDSTGTPQDPGQGTPGSNTGNQGDATGNQSIIIGGDNTQVIEETFEGELPAEPDQVSWIATRVFGFIAYALLFISVVMGLLKRARVCQAYSIFKYHCDISLMSVIVALFHGVSNIFDKFMWNLGIDRVFIPSFGSYTSILISVGIIAFYAMAIVTFTTMRKGTMRKLGAKRWRYIHMTSYVVFIIVFVHSLLLGTDLKAGDGPAYFLFVESGFVILGLSVYAALRSMDQRKVNRNTRKTKKVGKNE